MQGTSLSTNVSGDATHSALTQGTSSDLSGPSAAGRPAIPQAALSSSPPPGPAPRVSDPVSQVWVSWFTFLPNSLVV